MFEFVPARGLGNGHWMTVYSWGRRRRFPRLPSPSERLFDVEQDTRVLAHCFWQEDRAGRPALLALHGLEGSSGAHYMLGMAEKAFTLGFSVVLLNQRNCGGTEHMGPGLYHSGLTADAAHVIDELTTADRLGAIAVAGYSLGGNLALKLAGDFGSAAPPVLKAVCAVSPIIEVGRCVDALERWTNRAYQWNFVKDLKRRMQRKAALFPGRYPIDRLRSVKTVRDFDEAITAPHFGFRGAADYYHRASAMRVIDRVRVPTLVLSSRDDPFVPADLFDAPALRQNPWITPIITRHGGHCGFIGRGNGHDDPYWAESKIVEFAARHCGPEKQRNPAVFGV